MEANADLIYKQFHKSIIDSVCVFHRLFSLPLQFWCDATLSDLYSLSRNVVACWDTIQSM